jgi:hypothetical protein
VGHWEGDGGGGQRRGKKPVTRRLTDLKRVDPIRVSLQRVEALLPLRIPDFDHVVVGTADHQLAVVLHTPHSGQMTDEDVKALAGVYPPDPQSRVPAPAHDLVTVQMHTAHRRRVAEQRVYALARLRVPHL